MARPRKHRPNLTEKAVRAAKPPERGRLELLDGAVDRLVLRVTASGAKSWSVLYQSPVTGKQERVTIGPWPRVTVKTARTRAKQVHAAVALGGCPRSEERETARAARSAVRPTTFAEVAAAYLEQQQGRIRSWRNIETALENHLLPTLGTTAVGDVRRGDIHRVLDGLIAQGKRGAAREVKKHAHAILRWAHSRELVDRNVAYDLHVPELRRRAGDEAGRALEDEELRALWTCTEAEGFPWRQLVRLLVLTGCRKMEVTALRWSDVDLRARTFTIREDKSGNRRTVPLSEPALAEIRTCPRFVGADDPYIFSFRGGASHVSPGSFNKMLRGEGRLHDAMERELGRPVERFRPAHDFRVTAATHMSRLGVPREWVEAAQGRAAPALHAIYNKHDFEAEVRQALSRLGEHVMEVTGGSRESGGAAGRS